MALQHILTKLTYIFKTTKVSSTNLNDIQDAVIELQQKSLITDEQTLTAEQQAQVCDNIGVASGEAVEALSDSIADEYSSSATYKLGQLCIHDNTLYRCTTAIITAESWNSAHWAATTIAEEIENRCLFFTGVIVSATTGTILSKSDNRITADHVVASCVWAAPSNITTDVTWTTAAGSLTMTGTCSTATTADIILVKKNN